MSTVVRSLIDRIPGRYDIRSGCWTPADRLTRQQWQEAVEAVIAELRKKLCAPAFGLSETEISVHYHRPFHQFAHLVETKLGMDGSARQ